MKEFISTLIKQSIDKTNRYCPDIHKTLNIGDIILLKDVYIKPNNFEMAIVKSIVFNDLGEVTDVICKKGKTNDFIKRHVASVIQMITLSDKNSVNEDSNSINSIDLDCNELSFNNLKIRLKRKVALKSAILTKEMLSNMAPKNCNSYPDAIFK